MTRPELERAIATCANWSTPRKVEGTLLRLGCAVAKPATDEQISTAWPQGIPSEVRELWSLTRSADFFADADFGQWGLRLLSPESSATRSSDELTRRPRDIRPDDIVIGEFLGDQDLLVVDALGHAMVATPLDPRVKWFQTGVTLSRFLLQYVESQGTKFWEQRRPEN